MAKDHGPSVKDDKQYEGLRKKGMSKQRAASIAELTQRLEQGRQEERQGQRRLQVAEASGRPRGRQEVFVADKEENPRTGEDTRVSDNEHHELRPRARCEAQLPADSSLHS